MQVSLGRFSVIVSVLGSFLLVCAQVNAPYAIGRKLALNLVNPSITTALFSKYTATLLNVVETGIKNNTLDLQLDTQALEKLFDFIDAHGALVRQHLVKVMVANVNMLSKSTNINRTVDSSSINDYLNHVQEDIKRNRSVWLPLCAKVLTQLQQEVKAGRLHLNIAKNDMTNVAHALSVVLILIIEQHPLVAAHPQLADKVKQVIAKNMPLVLKGLSTLINQQKKKNSSSFSSTI